jgi:hypothetical protein
MRSEVDCVSLIHYMTLNRVLSTRSLISTAMLQVNNTLMSQFIPDYLLSMLHHHHTRCF